MFGNGHLLLLYIVVIYVHETQHLNVVNVTETADVQLAITELVTGQKDITSHVLRTEEVSTGSYNGHFNISTITSAGDDLSTTTDITTQSELYYQLDLSQSDRYLAQDVTYFVCGSRGLCNDSLPYRKELCSFECEPCKCDLSCHFYGDCCPDTLFDDNPEMPSPYFICTVDRWSTWDEFANIFMIGKCPLDSDVGTAAKCEFPDKTIQTEATPVSIVGLNLTYRNKFCAKCHGVTDYEIWRHEVTCSLLSSVQTATSKADLWRIVVQDRHCDITSRPPGLTSVRECYPVQYKTCSASGRVTKAPDPIVERLCHMYSHPVRFYGSDPFYESYRNIFCSICDDNVIDLNPSSTCERILSPNVPFPLNVLLDFNPVSESIVKITECEIGQALDPFTSSCQNISCPLRRSLVGNECEEIFSTASGLGIAMNVILQPANKSLGMTGEGFTDQYTTMLKEKLEDFSPIVVHFVFIGFYASDFTKFMSSLGELIKVHITIVSQTTRSLQDLETVLFEVMTSNFTYKTEDQNITLLSDPILCPSKYKVPRQFIRLDSLNDVFMFPLSVLDKNCKNGKCMKNIIFESVQLNCPYVEYNLNENITFTFFQDNHSVSFESDEFDLSPFRYLLCGEMLRICTDELNSISKLLVRQVLIPEEDLTLSLVSLVCMSLSLTGLALTFTTYSLIPTLRTLPGKNTMALVLNLFVAQLLFLTGSNRTTNIVICQVLGVLIHYFWLSSFAWMFISAYHMFLVFTTLVTKPINSGHFGRFLRYVLVCTVCPTLIVGVCLTVFLVTSDGMNSGYGGRVCFISNPMAILGFFAGPLGLMLLLNIFFFVRTVQTIRSVPDMTTSSNQNNRHHVFVYLKLSLLFGFTWIFGLLAEILQSNVLNYAFVVLTASQGLMLFVGYCLNARTWSLLKNQILQAKSEASSNISYPSQASNLTTNSSISQ